MKRGLRLTGIVLTGYVLLLVFYWLTYACAPEFK